MYTRFNKSPFNRDVWNKQPCTRLRLQSIISHERTSTHKDSVKLESAAAASRSIVHSINALVPSRGMEQAFSCLYFLAKRRIAHTTYYEPLLDLAGILGVNIKEKISVARNATYTSDKTIQEMIFFLENVHPVPKEPVSPKTGSWLMF